MPLITSWSSIAIALCALNMHILHNSLCYDFDQSHFAVSFSPYVKHMDNFVVFPKREVRSYTLQNVKTMLEVISGKFTKVYPSGFQVEQKFYTRNYTYHHECFSSVFTAEAAALINRENESKILTVVIEIDQHYDPLYIEVATRVTLEAIEKANSIFPGTVEGFYFKENFSNPNATRRILTFIKDSKITTSHLDIKLGTTGFCSQFESPENNGTMSKLQSRIIQEVDFIICDLIPTYKLFDLGPVERFENIKKLFLKYETLIKNIKPEIPVLLRTAWPGRLYDVQNSVDNQRIYCEIVNEWASKENKIVIMEEAFNNPIRPSLTSSSSTAAFYGWWRLTNNSLINDISGYIEKATGHIGMHKRKEPKIVSISEDIKDHSADPEQDSSSSLSIWDYVGWPTLTAIIIASISVVLIVSLVAMMFRRRRNHKKRKQITDQFNDFFNGTSSASNGMSCQMNANFLDNALNSPYDTLYEISKDDLQTDNGKLLGAGQFGCVFEGTLKRKGGNIPVAVKMIRTDMPKLAMRGILSEIKILTYLGKHENIVGMVGAYTAELSSGLVYLATELCRNGSLESYLRKCQIKRGSVEYNVSLRELVKWSHEIACGMAYLGTKHVVHADLATRNVLLTAEKTAKITDFGLSRRMYDYQNYVKSNQEPLPWRWMAIESLKRCEFSAQSDVWSYGVTLWEIFTMGDIPYPGLSWNLNFVTRLETGLRLESPWMASTDIYSIMSACWHEEPCLRPTFTDLTMSIIDLIENLEKYENI